MNLKQSRTNRLVLLAMAAVFLLVLTPSTVAAIDRRTGEQVVIDTGETITDNLIVTATTVTINGRVIGDVVTMAQAVEINGVIEGDLFALGGGVVVNGTVTDDVLVGAAIIRLDPQARIGNNLWGSGASIEMLPGSQIDGSLFFIGGQALLAGTVERDVVFSGNSLLLRGAIGRNVEASVDAETEPAWISQLRVEGIASPPAAPAGLTVRPRGADWRRSGVYQPDACNPPAWNCCGGRCVFTEETRTPPPPPTLTDRILDLIRRFAGLFLLGLILVWLTPHLLRGTTDELKTRPVASLGWGIVSILAIVLVFLAVILLTIAASVVLGSVRLNGLMGIVVAAGFLVGMALILLTILAIAYVAQIVVGFEVGRQILLRLRPAWVERPFAPLALGLLLLVVMTAAPAIGWMVSIVAVLCGLGALWMLGRKSLVRQPVPVVALAG
jgi:cytoskeletal protein CcmA (bactofilin family)